MLGAENTIRLFKPEIIIETRKINKYKIFESLSKYGYKFCLISNELIPVVLQNLTITNYVNIYAYADVMN